METNTVRFDPPRRTGLIFHLAVILVLSALVVVLFTQATLAELGPVFLLYLLGALFLAVPLPVLVNRLYALNRSSYLIERDGIRLQWGFRLEDIPIDQVLWVRPAEDLEEPIILPRLRWPGAVVGVQPQGDVGDVEFMAAEDQPLVLIGTEERVYAISPGDQNDFLQAFERQTELGSLSPFPPYSAHPRFIFADIWGSPTARAFMVISVVLSLALFIWVALAVPNTTEVSLGFSPSGHRLDPVPAVQLFLLPVLNLLLLLGAFVLSVYFERQQKDHPLAFVLWLSSAITVGLFLGAVYLILEIS
jgi:hypothetical protein